MKKFLGNVMTIIIGNLLTIVVVVLVIGAFAVLSIADSWFQNKGIKDGSVLELTFNSSIMESPMDEGIVFFISTPATQIYLRDVIQSIKKAKEDDKIKGISLKISSFQGGASQLTDVRNALMDFKSSGKFIYAYSHNSDQSGYILNSVADSLFQNPLGMVTVQGLSTEVMFFKNFGDKYGIDFQVIRHGAYKSAVEPYLREDLSPENREQLTLLLNDIWGDFSSNIAKSRKLSIEKLNKQVDSLYSFNPELALHHKLVDKTISEREYDHIIAKKIELDGVDEKEIFNKLEKHTVSLGKYVETLTNKSNRNRIAILYASGAIMPGDSYSGIQSGVYVETIRNLIQDEDVKAVVLRINSPGGSADASEEILTELRELKKKKPVIVSFGDVAASGGYYIAMESDSIFANPNTITGSIGVLGMMPNVKKMVNNIGITTDYVKTNENADFLKSPFQPLSEQGVEAMTGVTESVYKIFVNHVVAARNLTFEQVDSIGGGRVWSGNQAVKLGLVDRIGTLDDALLAAAKKADIEEYTVVSYPFKKGGFEEYLKEIQGVKTEVYMQQELGQEYYQIYQELKSMKEYSGIQLRIPFKLKLN